MELGGCPVPPAQHIPRCAPMSLARQSQRGDHREEVPMSTTDGHQGASGRTAGNRSVDLKLEAVVVPVADPDRSKEFYAGLGWRLDADFSYDNGFRVVQFTPPGSMCSIQFGTKITAAAPGSAHGLYLVVSDIDAGRAELIDRGAKVSEVFHAGASGAQLQPDDMSGRVDGSARITRATAPLPPSRTRTATAGCCRRSPTVCQAGLTPTSPRSAPPATWRAHCDVRKQPTASTRSASARPTPTGPTGTPRSWWPNKRAQSFPRER